MGLKQNDLRGLVYDIIGIDEFSSKMGENSDIVTLSFEVKTADPADDLCNFFEKGYSFVLDADVSPGETHTGNYLVFVELERNKHVPDNIIELVNDVCKLADIDKFKFRYYKQFRSHPVTLDNLQELVPTDPNQYGIKQQDSVLDFFDKGFVESVQLNGDLLVISNSRRNDLVFEILDYGSVERISPTITESADLMESYPEILYLTKQLGDYNICKYGDKIVLENHSNLLVLKRIAS